MSGGAVTPAAPAGARKSLLLPYAQLLRIPNVFTAMADIGLAALATGAFPGQTWPFLFLLLGSSCIYCSGMVWNDYFDYAVDLKERPFRPLPSHRIARATAARLGTMLIMVGMVFAGLAGVRASGFFGGSLVVAFLLVGAVMLYDAWLKQTFLGPVGMGLCRFLNVLLGLTVAPDGIPPWGFVLALVVGIYIVGVTWFARREAGASSKLELVAAALVMLTALPLALFLPVLGDTVVRGDAPIAWRDFLMGEFGIVMFPYLLVAFGMGIGIPIAAAIRNPSPKYVQRAIKRAVLGLVILDAVLATAMAGTIGLILLVLLPPALLLGRWVYST
jgi:4-hydroxybenzoate polyprenyltransferase